MNHYLVTLQLRSGLGSQLRAETLWGHLCWGIRYRSGSEALQTWLQQYDLGTPPLILSDPFPQGFVPRPRLPGPPAVATRPDTRTAADRKQVQRRVWISEAGLAALQSQLSADRLAAIMAADTADPPAATETSITQAGINRLTGGTEQPDGGALYTSSVHFFRTSPQQPAAAFDVYVSSPEPSETVQQWFCDGLSGGYGRDAATGRGDLRLTSIVRRTPPAVSQANAVLLLGPTVPGPRDPARGYFASGVYSGRVGGDFAVADTPDGSGQRQKYPVRYLQAGSVLVCPPQTAAAGIPEYVGRVIRDVHPWSEIRHYGLGLTWPVRLDDALVHAAF